jgi:hypothetical protein
MTAIPIIFDTYTPKLSSIRLTASCEHGSSNEDRQPEVNPFVKQSVHCGI